MGLKERYERARRALLNDRSICKENRALFSAFFAFEEYKLRRQNGLATLDDPCYRTLSGYVMKFRNVNSWFENKPWKQLTQQDIKRVYDALEDGKIKNRAGKKFEDRAGYYNKVFKSKPFRLAGVAELAKEVMEFAGGGQRREVRFVTKEEFEKLVSVVANPTHLALFWLQFDIGENISTLLRLQKRDFTRQQNPYTKEPEYIVNLPRDKIKRSRKTRSEPTLFGETVKYLDMVLQGLGREEFLFHFGHRQALKVMQIAARRSGAKCLPENDSPTWKDLRSGMACHLLRNGWTREEVNARLGHTPSSKALDAYINFLAIDRHRPKKKLYTTSLEEVQHELDESRRREKLNEQRTKRLMEDMERLQGERRRLHELEANVAKFFDKTEKEKATMERQHREDLKMMHKLFQKKRQTERSAAA